MVNTPSEVQEVLYAESVTRWRHAPAEVLGAMNPRGKSVTSLDRGIILGLRRSVPARESRVFIVENRNEFIGILVDRAGEQARFFQRVCRWRHVIALLNPAEVLKKAKQE
jgi:chemotaxis signal transduction protein